MEHIIVSNICKHLHKHAIILEWTTRLDTSSRTLYWNGQLGWDTWSSSRLYTGMDNRLGFGEGGREGREGEGGREGGGREGGREGRMSVRMSTSRRTSSYVIRQIVIERRVT